MEFEKVFDQLLMPISCNVCGSFSESATDSVGQSQDSSKIHITASVESWMSESSCDCHSPRQPVQKKSQLTFYNRSILPPLLCSSAKIDMQIDKRRAVEKEKARQENSSCLSVKVESNFVNSKFAASNNANAENGAKIKPTVEKVSCFVDDESAEEKMFVSPLALVDSEILKEVDIDSSSKPLDVDCGFDESSFQENAYRNSLQNLLLKSASIHKPVNTCSQDASDANESGDAQTAIAGTIAPQKDATSDGSCDLSAKNVSLQEVNTLCPENEPLELQINKIAENLVNSVIETVKLELCFSDFQSPNSDSSCRPSQNTDELPLKSCSVQCPYFSPRSMRPSSPCRATEQIDRALLLLENEFLLPFNSQEKSGNTFSSPESPIQTEPLFLHPDDLKNSGSPILVRKTETSLLEGSTDATSEAATELDVEELRFECTEQENSAVTMPAASHSNPCSPTLVTSENRTRNDSFSVETPSSFLLSSRSTHTIYSEGKNLQSDVKRRLDMRSESDDSLLSTAITDVSLKPIEVKERVNVPGFYKLMEEQHKTEMLELQQHHHKQLEDFRQNFLNCQLFSPQQLCVKADIERNNFFSDRMDLKLHRKWCKLSALIKGHLTRMLLRSSPVQSCMKTIRDTSRTILLMKSEDTSRSTNMSAIQDATLMNRLFLQLKAAMFEFHAFFFDTPIFEQIDMIKRTRDAEAKSVVQEISKRTKVPKLSAATLKSLQRKKDIRNLQRARQRIQPKPKEVKSKVSSIWKTSTSKRASKESTKIGNRSPSVKQSNCKVESPLTAWKQPKTKENIAF